MAALMNRTQVGLKPTSSAVNVPSAPKARLMYYLDCISTVLNLDNTDEDINRLRNFSQHYLLTDDETKVLVALCYMISPDVLTGKCMFQDDDMCGASQNCFFELSSVESQFLVTDSVLIGGQRTRVQNIMCYKESWLINNWLLPMKQVVDELERPKPRAITYVSTYTPPPATYVPVQHKSSCCVIL
jgi:hypothetical protein